MPHLETPFIRMFSSEHVNIAVHVLCPDSLSVLYKHWLLWRQVCSRRFLRSHQEWWSCVWWDRRLQSKAWTLWTLTRQRTQLAAHQYRYRQTDSVSVSSTYQCSVFSQILLNLIDEMCAFRFVFVGCICYHHNGRTGRSGTVRRRRRS